MKIDVSIAENMAVVKFEDYVELKIENNDLILERNDNLALSRQVDKLKKEVLEKNMSTDWFFSQYSLEELLNITYGSYPFDLRKMLGLGFTLEELDNCIKAKKKEVDECQKRLNEQNNGN